MATATLAQLEVCNSSGGPLEVAVVFCLEDPETGECGEPFVKGWLTPDPGGCSLVHEGLGRLTKLVALGRYTRVEGQARIPRRLSTNRLCLPQGHFERAEADADCAKIPKSLILMVEPKRIELSTS